MDSVCSEKCAKQRLEFHEVLCEAASFGGLGEKLLCMEVAEFLEAKATLPPLLRSGMEDPLGPEERAERQYQETNKELFCDVISAKRLASRALFMLDLEVKHDSTHGAKKSDKEEKEAPKNGSKRTQGTAAPKSGAERRAAIKRGSTNKAASKDLPHDVYDEAEGAAPDDNVLVHGSMVRDPPPEYSVGAVSRFVKENSSRLDEEEIHMLKRGLAHSAFVQDGVKDLLLYSMLKQTPGRPEIPCGYLLDPVRKLTRREIVIKHTVETSLKEFLREGKILGLPLRKRTPLSGREKDSYVEIVPTLQNTEDVQLLLTSVIKVAARYVEPFTQGVLVTKCQHLLKATLENTTDYGMVMNLLDRAWTSPMEGDPVDSSDSPWPPSLAPGVRRSVRYPLDEFVTLSCGIMEGWQSMLQEHWPATSEQEMIRFAEEGELVMVMSSHLSAAYLQWSIDEEDLYQAKEFAVEDGEEIEIYLDSSSPCGFEGIAFSDEEVEESTPLDALNEQLVETRGRRLLTLDDLLIRAKSLIIEEEKAMFMQKKKDSKVVSEDIVYDIVEETVRRSEGAASPRAVVDKILLDIVNSAVFQSEEGPCARSLSHLPPHSCLDIVLDRLRLELDEYLADLSLARSALLKSRRFPPHMVPTVFDAAQTLLASKDGLKSGSFYQLALDTVSTARSFSDCEEVLNSPEPEVLEEALDKKSGEDVPSALGHMLSAGVVGGVLLEIVDEALGSLGLEQEGRRKGPRQDKSRNPEETWKG